MPIKKDGTGKRWVAMEFATPGTPEQVWQAIATGPGNSAWFTRATIDGRVGGALRFDFGPEMGSTGEVTAWEPPHRFGFIEREWSEGAPPVATEITVTSRSGDRCVVRMVHSLFASTDDWDEQLESFESGWPFFFEVLRIYLGHHAGQPAAQFQAMVHTEGDQLDVWKRLMNELALGGANVGERRTTPARPEALTGVVEVAVQDSKQRLVTMRLEAPAPGVAIIGTCGHDQTVSASINLYFYGDNAGSVAAASEPRWRDWLSSLFSTAQSAAR
jgi:uncharacterized protein YndB with AHSA1/START domain